MANINKSATPVVKANDGRVAQLLVYLVNAVTDMNIDVGDINIDLDVTNDLLQGVGGSVETPALIRSSGIGAVAAGASAVYIRNLGGANGSVLGTTLKPGEGIPFEAKVGNTLAEIGYVATGTDFLISTTTV